MLTDQELQSLRNLGNEAERAADMVFALEQNVARLETYVMQQDMRIGELEAENARLTADARRLQVVTCGGGPPGDPNGELAQLHADLRDFLLHVIDMSKGDHYWDVVRLNAEALLQREALTGHGIKPWGGKS